MAAVGSGYDVSCGSYSPDGRIFQIDYALKAVEQHGLCAGIRTNDCVVLGIQKDVGDVLEIDTVRRIFQVEDHILIAVVGMLPDGRALVSKALEYADSYRRNYDRLIPTSVLADTMSRNMQLYTHYGEVRPFGCSLLIAGTDNDNGTPRFSLYHLQPSGDITSCFGAVAGRRSLQAKVELEHAMGPQQIDENDNYNHLKRLHNDGGQLATMSEAVAMDVCAKAIWACHDEGEPSFLMDFAVVRADGCHIYDRKTASQIQARTSPDANEAPVEPH